MHACPGRLASSRILLAVFAVEAFNCQAREENRKGRKEIFLWDAANLHGGIAVGAIQARASGFEAGQLQHYPTRSVLCLEP